MKYLHTMVRVSNIEESLDFWCNKLGLIETRRIDFEKGRFTLIFLVASDDQESSNEIKVPRIRINL
jgi:lactoylglutathione lyase